MRSILNRHSGKTILVFGVMTVAVLLGLFQDLMHSKVNNYNFYFSESMLYNSFWMFFLPLVWMQVQVLTKIIKNNLFKSILTSVLITLAHLIIFALFVNVTSGIFVNHTFRFSQVFDYAISNHFIISIAVYSTTAVFYYFKTRKRNFVRNTKEPQDANGSSLIPVTTGNKTTLIEPTSILYISSERPYVAIHTPNKKWLYKGTLKAFESNLERKQFCRIHKSTIVNTEMITGFTSRGNGDFDLQLNNGEQLRMSRNYAEGFKKRFKLISS